MRRQAEAGGVMEQDGWNYTGHPEDGTDARKLVTLTEGGMMWIGIRAWNSQHQYWMNGGEPERIATVKAWRDLPEIARGFWDRGKLTFPDRRISDNPKYFPERRAAPSPAGPDALAEELERCSE